MKIIRITVFLLFCSLCPLLSQNHFNLEENQHRRHLVIVHPTRANLERYSLLVKEGILDPGNRKLVGVYFEAENYAYENVIKDFPDFGFHCIPGMIGINDLYIENSATEEFRKVFQYSDGIIFNGGPDIPPAAYGEEMSTLTVVLDPYRHYFEISFLFHLLGSSRNEEFEAFLKKRPKYAVLGICLGMQKMNVAAGGNLIQDIPSEIYGKTSVESIVSMETEMQHRNYYADLNLHPEIRPYILHKIKIIPGRWIYNELKYTGDPEPSVFSSHHQAIDRLGENLRVAATSLDGRITEAIEHTRYPNVFGIQFHPEVNYLYQTRKAFKFNPDDEKFSLKEELIRRESLDFHLKFWKLFGDSL